MNASEVLVEMLKAYEVKHVFGLPGDTTMPLYDALYHARGDVHHIMTRDERSSSFMADAYARLSGKPGVCEAPSGGGATYVIPGVAEANGSSVPMVVFTSDVPVVDEHKGTLTAIDQKLLLEAATKWSTVVRRPQMLPDIIRRAFRIATSGRPGAVHIVLPEDILHEMAPDVSLHAEAACTHYPSYRTQAPAASLEAILAELLRAKNPVMVVGGGGVLSGSGAEVARLAELLHIPVGTTINGKGSIAETHPWSIGVIGGNGGRPYANQMLTEADCIFFVGTKVNSLVTLGGRIPSPERDVTILQLDADPSELGNNLATKVAACGDARESLAALLQMAESRGVTAPERLRTVEDLAAMWDAFWARAQERAGSDDYPMSPQRVINGLWETAPEDVVVVADPGTMTPYTAAQFRVRQAGRSIVIPRAHGGLGYALPATVGAAYARPDQRIVGLVGDGSFGMSGMELETISRLNLPITLIHFNNGSYGWIKMLQKLYFDERYYGVDFTPTVNYAGVAEALGVRGIRIEHPDQLESAMAEALASDGPTFIDVPTISELEETPPVDAWLEALKRQEAVH